MEHRTQKLHTIILGVGTNGGVEPFRFREEEVPKESLAIDASVLSVSISTSWSCISVFPQR
jgi:hypothetical protein